MFERAKQMLIILAAKTAEGDIKAPKDISLPLSHLITEARLALDKGLTGQELQAILNEKANTPEFKKMMAQQGKIVLEEHNL